MLIWRADFSCNAMCCLLTQARIDVLCVYELRIYSYSSSYAHIVASEMCTRTERKLKLKLKRLREEDNENENEVRAIVCDISSESN